MHYPGDYGFIPGTLAEDNDPMDILCLVNEPSFTGCLIEVRPVGILNMVDNDEGDQKVLAVPNRNPRYDQIHTMDQVFPHVKREIEHFFTIYKELEGRVTRMEGWGGPREARKAIMQSRQRYLESVRSAGVGRRSVSADPRRGRAARRRCLVRPGSRIAASRAADPGLLPARR